MPSPRKAVAKSTTATASKRSSKWQGRKTADRGSTLTHERLAEQIKAFRKAGGKIEVLGTTQSLRNIETPNGSKSATTALPTPARLRTR